MEVLSIAREQVQTLNTVPWVISLRTEIEFLLALYLQVVCKESEHSRTGWQSEYCYYHR